MENVQNLTTGYIFPQYHYVFGELFQEVFDESFTDAVCNKYFEHNWYCYIEEEFGQDGELIYSPPPLYGVLLDEPEWRDQKDNLSRQFHTTGYKEYLKWIYKIQEHIDSNSSPPLFIPVDDDSLNSSSVLLLGGDVCLNNYIHIASPPENPPPAPNIITEIYSQ